MSRADDLTLHLLERPGTAAERVELARLLERDTRARLRHLTLLEVEATLRGRARHPDVADEVMARIRSERKGKRARTVEQPALPARSRLSRHRSGPLHRRLWLLWLFLLGSAVTAGLASDRLRRGTAEAEPITRAPAR